MKHNFNGLLIIESTANAQVTSRVVNANGKSDVKYQQKVYLHQGGEYPLPFTIDLRDQYQLREGFYQIQPSAFRCSQYGKLELAVFDLVNHLKAVPVPQAPQAQK